MDSSNSNYEVDARETLRWLEHKKRERFGMHTTMMIYVAMKWMTFASLLFQFNLMAKIYASGELLWGVHISYELLNGAYKNVYTGVFPQIVGCNPHRAQLGGVVNEFIMRCILPQNFVNSKVFLFLYWWYILAMLVSIYSAVQFTAMLFLPKYQRYATKSLLPTEEFFNEHAEKPTKGSLEFFVDYMGNDGYLLLQCASVPLSVVRIRFFLNSLYTIVVEKKKEYEDQKPMVPRKQKTPIDHIQFDGPDRSGTKGPYKNGKAMIMSDGDSYTKQLLSHSSPSCSPASSQRYSAAPGKNLEDYE